MIYKTLHRKTKIKQHSPTKNRGWIPGQVVRNGDLIDWLIDWLIVGVLTPPSAISWRPVLVVEEAGVPGENHPELVGMIMVHSMTLPLGMLYVWIIWFTYQMMFVNFNSNRISFTSGNGTADHFGAVACYFSNCEKLIIFRFFSP
jgi:hypothetical protein